MDAKYYRPGIDHAIGVAVEEGGELSTEIGKLHFILGKTLRWGLDSYHPDQESFPPEERVTNAETIMGQIWACQREFLDFQTALNRLEIELRSRKRT